MDFLTIAVMILIVFLVYRLFTGSNKIEEKNYDAFKDAPEDNIEVSIKFNNKQKYPKKKTTTTKNNFIYLRGKKAIKDSFVVFDIETTGLHAGNNEIIEIAAIKIDDINSSNHKTFNALIKPKKSIPSNITKLTGITNNMVQNADDINTVLKDFCEFIEDYPLVGHNIDFDVKFVSNKANKCNIKFKNKMLIDTLPLARKAFPELNNHKLTTLVEHIGINVDRSHRALDDVKATLYVYTTSTQLLY